MSKDPQDTITVHVKTELQYDVDAQQSAFPSGSLSALAVTTSSRGDLRSNVYYINSGSVFNAYQDPTLPTTGSPPWSVENMHFPTTNPNIIRTITVPNSSHDMVVVVTQDGMNAYILEVGIRFPQWVALPSATNAPITDCRLFITSQNVLNIAVMSSGGMYIADPTTVMTDGWVEDTGVRGAFAAGIHNFDIDPSLGSTVNDSVFGYAIASVSSGLGLLTGGDYTLDNPAILTPVDSGTYSSVVLAHFTNDAASSKPLVFATDSILNAYYFQLQDNNTYVKVPIFSGIKVQQLQAAVRTRLVEGTEKRDTRIEVFALDNNGTIYHLESGYDAIAKVNKLILLNNGSYAVQAWRQNYAQISTDNSAITSAVSPDGNAFLVSYSQSGQANSVTFINQDPDTSDWTRMPVALPASTSSVIRQSKAYYVEIIAMDGNRLPLAGRGMVISSVQYAVININGRTTVVDPNRFTTAVANVSGSVCIVVETSNSLGVPTFTAWVEGMDPNSIIDVQPNGSIESKFASLDRQMLRAATNKTDPANPPLFPSTISDAQLDLAASTIKEVINIVDPGFIPANLPLAQVDSTHPSRRYLHQRTLPAVATTRKRSQRSRAHIRGKADYGLHLTVRPSLQLRKISSAEAAVLREAALLNFLNIDLSWGDLWEGIKSGFYTVKSYVIDPVVDAIQATIYLFKDEVNYAWNGLVNFVQKAYDVVSTIFESIGAAFDGLFGWLAYILDWDDIKRSAAHFQNLMNGFQNFGQITQNSFAQIKAWLNTNIGVIEAAIGAGTVSTYDQDQLPPTASASDSSQGLLLDLPSTATWLMNKIFNAADGTAAAIEFSSATTTLQSLWDKLSGEAQAVGLNSDLQAAYQSVGNVLLTFRDRGVFDSESFASLLELVKAFIFVILDIAELAMLSLESVITEALKFFWDIMNATLDIPVISLIFKELTGSDLTLLNTAIYIMAIPFTVLYKTIAGSTPFMSPGPLSQDLGTPQDDINLTRGILLVCNGLWGSIVDLLFSEYAAFGVPIPIKSWILRLVTGINITTNIVLLRWVAILTSRVALLWAVGIVSPGISIVYAAVYRGLRGPAGDPVGQTLLTLTGAAQLGLAAWQTKVLHDSGWTPKTVAAVTASWLSPWGNLARGLNTLIANLDPFDAQFVIVAQLVINLVSGLGPGIALIVSSRMSPTPLIAEAKLSEEESEESKKDA